MIQKGIVESIISQYEYKVRIPRYDKLVTTPGGVPTEDLASAIVCSIPGTKIAFAENDIVLVDFENNELNKPVILGLLYRENNGEASQFNVISSERDISKIDKVLSELQANQLYTHIKYSNDNGITFTSLYEYSDVNTFSTGQSIYRGINDIIIDPTSTVIYWSVLDADNNDITSELTILTTLSNEDNSVTETFSDTLINIPVKFQGLETLKLSFRILQTSEYDSYHIVLTTDKNTLGSVYGDYIGICVSTNPIPQLNPSYYSWGSFYQSIYRLVSNLENSLLPRVERNEKALYGYTYSTSIQESDSTGLLDGIRVEKDTIHIYGAENKNINFNSSKSIYIDNEHDNITTKNLDYTSTATSTVFSDGYSDNGHLILVARKKVN